MEHITLNNIEHRGTCVSFRFSTQGKETSRLFVSNELWIDYGTDMSQVPESILTIPFVAVMLPIVWVTDAVLWIRDLDLTFYESCFNLRRAYSELYSKYPLKGRIVPCKLTENSLKPSEEAWLLFSGGLDAHTSYIRHQFHISHLVNIQGWFRHLGEHSKAAEADRRDISLFAKRNGKQFDYITSNFAILVPPANYRKYAKAIGDSLWHGFQHSMAFISFTIPLCYKQGCSQIIIASSFTIGDERVCASYPTTDVEFRFASAGKTIHDGFELSRQDKIRVIVDYQKIINAPYPIRVCSFNDTNCCHCEKCFRTIMGLAAENTNIADFGFNINKPLLQYYTEYFGNKDNMAQFGVRNEALSHWPHIRQRMIENYEHITRNKDLVDWFLGFDFIKAKHSAVRYYYAHHFFNILMRKIKNHVRC